MAGMASQLKQRAMKAYSTSRSTEMVKVIQRSDIVALNKSMEAITQQNARESIASENAAAGVVFGGRE